MPVSNAEGPVTGVLFVSCEFDSTEVRFPSGEEYVKWSVFSLVLQAFYESLYTWIDWKRFHRSLACSLCLCMCVNKIYKVKHSLYAYTYHASIDPELSFVWSVLLRPLFLLNHYLKGLSDMLPECLLLLFESLLLFPLPFMDIDNNLFPLSLQPYCIFGNWWWYPTKVSRLNSG